MRAISDPVIVIMKRVNGGVKTVECVVASVDIWEEWQERQIASLRALGYILKSQEDDYVSLHHREGRLREYWCESWPVCNAMNET